MSSAQAERVRCRAAPVRLSTNCISVMDVGLSRVQHRMPAAGAGIGVGQGGGGSGGCATRGQTVMRGSFSAAGPFFVVRARCLRSSVAAEAVAHRDVADALARGCRLVPAASLADVVQVVLVGVGGRPAEAGEFARDSDRDDRAALAALCVQALPGAMQALLSLPADREDVRGLAGLAALEWLALGRRPTVVPGRLDQQPARVARAGFRDRALAACLA